MNDDNKRKLYWLLFYFLLPFPFCPLAIPIFSFFAIRLIYIDDDYLYKLWASGLVITSIVLWLIGIFALILALKSRSTLVVNIFKIGLGIFICELFSAACLIWAIPW